MNGTDLGIGSTTPLPSLRRETGCVPCLQKLERTAWTEGIAFTCHGARIGIRIRGPEILEHLQSRLPPGWRPARSPGVDDLYSLFIGGNGRRPNVRLYNLLYRQSDLLARTTDPDEALAVLESALHFNVAVRARRKLFVHAGVVGWRGRAIVIPGRSGSGKTTLVQALVRAGATYGSDEYAVFDERGSVHPYPKPLSVREPGADRPRLHPVEALGGRREHRPLPVGLVAVTAYRPGARWRPRALSPGEAVLALLSHTPLARIRPRFVLDRLTRVPLGIPTLRGGRGEAEETAASLLRSLDADSQGDVHVSPSPAGSIADQGDR